MVVARGGDGVAEAAIVGWCRESGRENGCGLSLFYELFDCYLGGVFAYMWLSSIPQKVAFC